VVVILIFVFVLMVLVLFVLLVVVVVIANKPGMLLCEYSVSMINHRTFFLLRTYDTNTSTH
jgi:hypothetical protein